MKRYCLLALLIGTIFTSHANKVNNPVNSEYNVTAEAVGLMSACWHKNVFNLLLVRNRPHSDPNQEETKKINDSIELLKEKCGITLIENKDTSKLFTSFDERLYIAAHLPSFYESVIYGVYITNEYHKKELVRIKDSFDLVSNCLKTCLANDVFEGNEAKAAHFIIEQLQKEIEIISTAISFFDVDKKTTIKSFRKDLNE